MKYQYTVHEKIAAYQGFFKFDRYTVSFEKFSGGMIEQVHRECGKKGDVVAVLPYDPIREVVILVEQFRIGMMVRGNHPWNLEIVAGFMDVDGEDERTTAQRELLEETGCTALALHPLIDYYPSPGGSASQVHVFLAEVDSSQALEFTGLEAEGEDIRVNRMPLAELRQQFEQNHINNGTAIIAFQQFFLHNWAEKLNSTKNN